jgi:predicted naringenin-chalcone synthase
MPPIPPLPAAPAIIGLGTAAPEGSISQTDSLAAARAFSAASLGGDERLLAVLYRKTNITRRGSVLLAPDGTAELFFGPAQGPADRGPGTAARLAHYRDLAPALANRAARAALQDAGIAPSRITHLITASCTGFDAPGLDSRLIQDLGLRPTTLRTHIGFMGCHAAINALRVAAAFAAASPEQDPRVLICCTELCTLHYQYGNNPDQLVANAIFADGAAAAIIGPSSPLTSDIRHPTSDIPLRSTASCIFPGSADAMTWSIGDHGFEMTLSSRVPDLLKAHLRGWITEWLGNQGGGGLALADIGSWAIHPGGPRILSTVAECLGLAPEQTADSQAILAEHGNMSSPTVLFILDRQRRAGRRGPTVALAFGPGLVAEAALLG